MPVRRSRALRCPRGRRARTCSAWGRASCARSGAGSPPRARCALARSPRAPSAGARRGRRARARAPPARGCAGRPGRPDRPVEARGAGRRRRRRGRARRSSRAICVAQRAARGRSSISTTDVPGDPGGRCLTCASSSSTLRPPRGRPSLPDPQGRTGGRSASTQVCSASSTWIEGTPATWSEYRTMRVVCLVTPWPGAAVVEQGGERAGLVGHHEPAAVHRQGVLSRPSCSPSPATRTPRAPLTVPASNAHTGTPVSTSATSSASSRRFSGLKPAAEQPLHRCRLDRRALGVGVQTDVAVEDAVGPGDRVLAHRHGMGARKRSDSPLSRSLTPGELRPGRASSVTEISRSSGNSLPDLFGDPARDGLVTSSEASTRAAPIPRRAAATRLARRGLVEQSQSRCA